LSHEATGRSCSLTRRPAAQETSAELIAAAAFWFGEAGATIKPPRPPACTAAAPCLPELASGWTAEQAPGAAAFPAKPLAGDAAGGAVGVAVRNIAGRPATEDAEEAPAAGARLPWPLAGGMVGGAAGGITGAVRSGVRAYNLHHAIRAFRQQAGGASA